MASRTDCLQVVLEEVDPCIVVLSEHDIKENEINNVTFDNYTLNSFYCRKTSVKGGVLIMSKKSLKFKKFNISDFDYLSHDKLLEFCATKFVCNEYRFIVVGVYRSPSSNVKEFLNRLNILISKMLSRCLNLVIVGDINIDVLKDSLEVRDLSKILISHGMDYLVEFPTRVCTTTATCIDNILTNIAKNQLKVEGLVTNLSDHDGQLLLIENKLLHGTKKKESITVYKRPFTTSNKKLFLKMLEEESWMNVYNASVESKFDVFYDTFTYYFNFCFPKVQSRMAQKTNKWITSELLDMKKEIEDYTIDYRLSKNPDIKNLLRKMNKDYKISVSRAKKNYYEKIINNSRNTSKVTWNIINNESGKKPKQKVNNISLYDNGTVVKSPYRVAKLFLEHYAGVVENQIIPNLVSCSTLSGYSSVVNFANTTTQFKPQFITDKAMSKVLDSFDNKYSAGIDDIPMPIIKCAKDYLIKPLTHLVNSSFISGIFPNKLKVAKVKPLFKHGDSCNVANYRPLSLLSSFSKIFERIMADQFTEYLETNNLIDLEQHGFRKGKSVISAGIEFVESVIDSVDIGDKAIGIFMDLTKAFDSVCHLKLLNSISNLGVSRYAFSWFESYLSNRSQYVEITHLNNHNQLINIQSPSSSIHYGVPQGSILGPLLFICYMKGLPRLFNFDKMTLYADDINLKISGKNVSDIERSATQQLSVIQNHLTDLNLLLNPNKTKYISFSTKQRRIDSNSTLFLNKQILEEVDSSRLLGILLDKNLDYTSHVEVVCKKIASGLYALRKMSFIINNIGTLKSIYFSFIHSHVSFGISLYGSTSIDNLDRILILQKEAVRIILKLNWLESVKEHFFNLNILTVYSLYIFEVILSVRKNLHKLTRVGSNHDYNTRGSNQIALESHRLTFFHKKPTHVGSKYYNLLPNDIKCIDNYNQFKKKLKLFMIKKALYSFKDFDTG